VVGGLGITWILDGLEVTLVASVAGALKESPVMQFSNVDVGLASSAYLAGAVTGSLFFGWLTDRLGRKKLFFITLVLYLLASLASACAWNVWSFVLFRFLTGAGIGGEYSAINSTIQELIPARVRGWTDLCINGSFWLGAAAGAAGSIVLLDPRLLPIDLGWRAAFAIGAILSAIVLVVRSWLPESPRWLVTHGRGAEANRIVAGIEARFRAEGHVLPPVIAPPVRLTPRTHTPLLEVMETLLRRHRDRTLVALALMISQAFFYNAIFFTYPLILTTFYKVPASDVGWFIRPFALGNFTGPLLLGRLFDTIGRRTMIAFTYAASGILLLATGWLFVRDVFTVQSLTLAWSVIFFFASAAASSAYLTVSETFPLEMRALAIAAFYAIGTGVGGVVGPTVFAWLVETGTRGSVFLGFAFGAVMMILAAGVAARWGVRAERRSLEDIATPLAAVER
jgi:MFS family permease